jgi:hypothetical protein
MSDSLEDRAATVRRALPGDPTDSTRIVVKDLLSEAYSALRTAEQKIAAAERELAGSCRPANDRAIRV